MRLRSVSRLLDAGPSVQTIFVRGNDTGVSVLDEVGGAESPRGRVRVNRLARPPARQRHPTSASFGGPTASLTVRSTPNIRAS